MATSIQVSVTGGDPKEIGAQVVSTLRRFARPAAVQPRVRPLWERGDLFREPIYTDGQPYGDDDEEAEEDR